MWTSEDVSGLKLVEGGFYLSPESSQFVSEFFAESEPDWWELPETMLLHLQRSCSVAMVTRRFNSAGGGVRSLRGSPAVRRQVSGQHRPPFLLRAAVRPEVRHSLKMMQAERLAWAPCTDDPCVCVCCRCCALQADSEPLKQAWLAALQGSIDLAYRQRADAQPAQVQWRSPPSPLLLTGSASCRVHAVRFSD